MVGTVISIGNSATGSCKKTRSQKGTKILGNFDDYAVIDIETTGLDAKFCDIIEFGALRVRDGKIVEKFAQLVNPGCEIDPFITQLTGISNEMVAHAPNINETLPLFKDFIGDDILLGHNVSFDINFIYDTFEACNIKPIRNDFLDTMQLSRRLFKELKCHKLSVLAEHFKIETTGAHRALADCLTCNELYIIEKNYIIQNNYDPKSIFAKHLKYSADAKDIVSSKTEFDETSPVFGKVFVFTGALENFLRKDAMQIVADLGGVNGNGVTRKTNYLVIGNFDFCPSVDEKSSKQKKAEKLMLDGYDIAIISEQNFLDLIASEEPICNEITNSPEQIAFSYAKPTLTKLVEDWYLPETALRVEKSKTTNILSIKLYDRIICRYKLSGNLNYLEIPSEKIKYVPDGIEIPQSVSNKAFTRLPLESPQDAEQYTSMLYKILDDMIFSIPKEFSCCSRYVECSDALKCIHPDREFAKGCYYKKNLKQGKVFYGKNKNI